MISRSTYFWLHYLIQFLNFAGKVDFKNKLIELLDKFCEPDLKLIFQKYRQGDNGIDNAVSDAFECERVRRAYSTLGNFILE